jgi:hypothetical protein
VYESKTENHLLIEVLFTIQQVSASGYVGVIYRNEILFSQKSIAFCHFGNECVHENKITSEVSLGEKEKKNHKISCGELKVDLIEG